jgi:hypothetical protein
LGVGDRFEALKLRHEMAARLVFLQDYGNFTMVAKQAGGIGSRQ